jgi:hypothetical protein
MFYIRSDISFTKCLPYSSIYKYIIIE